MKTASVRVARRYARALALLTDEQNSGDAVRATLDSLVQALEGVPDALAFLANPTFDLVARQKVLVGLLDGCKATGTARNLVLLLLDKGRIAALPAVRDEFAALQDQRTGHVDGAVTSAVALPPTAVARLQAVLKRQLGKDVALTAAVDPALIGGLVVRVGNTIFDASIANQLARLHQQLVSD